MAKHFELIILLSRFAGFSSTRGHKTLGAKWLFEPRFSHQSSLYLDSEVAPKSPTILYRQTLNITSIA